MAQLDPWVSNLVLKVQCPENRPRAEVERRFTAGSYPPKVVLKSKTKGAFEKSNTGQGNWIKQVYESNLQGKKISLESYLVTNLSVIIAGGLARSLGSRVGLISFMLLLKLITKGVEVKSENVVGRLR